MECPSFCIVFNPYLTFSHKRNRSAMFLQRFNSVENFIRLRIIVAGT